MPSDRPDRPMIVVLAAEPPSGPAPNRVRAVCAGIEEEGVPHLVLPGRREQSAADLARSAAQRSELDVGVGVDTRGVVCVHHDKLAAPLPALTSEPGADLGVVRALGHNAARIVVGLPFKTVPTRTDGYSAGGGRTGSEPSQPLAAFSITRKRSR